MTRLTIPSQEALREAQFYAEVRHALIAPIEEVAAAAKARNRR